MIAKGASLEPSAYRSGVIMSVDSNTATARIKCQTYLLVPLLYDTVLSERSARLPQLSPLWSRLTSAELPELFGVLDPPLKSLALGTASQDGGGVYRRTGLPDLMTCKVSNKVEQGKPIECLLFRMPGRVDMLVLGLEWESDAGSSREETVKAWRRTQGGMRTLRGHDASYARWSFGVGKQRAAPEYGSDQLAWFLVRDLPEPPDGAQVLNQLATHCLLQWNAAGDAAPDDGPSLTSMAVGLAMSRQGASPEVEESPVGKTWTNNGRHFAAYPQGSAVVHAATDYAPFTWEKWPSRWGGVYLWLHVIARAERLNVSAATWAFADILREGTQKGPTVDQLKRARRLAREFVQVTTSLSFEDCGGAESQYILWYRQLREVQRTAIHLAEGRAELQEVLGLLESEFAHRANESQQSTEQLIAHYGIVFGVFSAIAGLLGMNFGAGIAQVSPVVGISGVAVLCAVLSALLIRWNKRK